VASLPGPYRHAQRGRIASASSVEHLRKNAAALTLPKTLASGDRSMSIILDHMADSYRTSDDSATSTHHKRQNWMQPG